jgi:hypothetical protein
MLTVSPPNIKIVCISSLKSYTIPTDNAAPGIEELMEALKPVSGKWYQIGLKLMLSGEELHSVESDLRGSSSDNYLELMLKTKFESGGESLTWKQVATSLRGAGETELAEKIAEDHSKAHPSIQVLVYIHVVLRQ